MDIFALLAAFLIGTGLGILGTLVAIRLDEAEDNDLDVDYIDGMLDEPTVGGIDRTPNKWWTTP